MSAEAAIKAIALRLVDFEAMRDNTPQFSIADRTDQMMFLIEDAPAAREIPGRRRGATNDRS